MSGFWKTLRRSAGWSRALTVCVLVVSGNAEAATDDQTDLARQLGDEAIKKNPDIRAINERIAALRENVRKAGAWLDPQTAVEYSNMPIDRWAPGGHPMSGIQFNLKQTFLFPGKTSLREAVAEGLVREEQQSLAERKVQLRAMVERAYYNLALVRHLRKVTQDHIKLVDQFLDAVRAKYEVGRAGQHDLIRLQVLAGKLRDDLKNFDRDERGLTATINAALHRSVSIAIPTPMQLAAKAPQETEKKLVDLARAHRPLLKRYQAIEATRKQAARQALREGYPDITASAGYRLRSQAGTDEGTDFIGLGLSLPIPIFYDRRWGTEQRKNERLARSASAKYDAELDRIRGALGRVVAGWKRAVSEAKEYRLRLMPMAHQALDATFAAYQVDRADFASLFQAELQLLTFERTIRRAEAGALMFRTDAESLVGRPLD